MFPSSMRVSAVLLLLIPWVSAQVTQCASDGSPQLRFVARPNVSGCALFVHDTGANDGLHLAVEPIMCVTEWLHKVIPRYDPVTQQMYVSVPVMLRDDAMLADVQRQVGYLSPKSVKFATVSDISIFTDTSSKFQALGFDWTPEDPTGILRLRLDCEKAADEVSKIGCLVATFRTSLSEILSHVLLSATVVTSRTISQLKYRPMLQRSSLSDLNINSLRYESPPSCQQLRFVRSIRLTNCTARVHHRQRLGSMRDFLIEPLLCHNITSMSNESVMYDYSRDMYYLKLDVVLQDDMTADAVRTQLADLSPRSVAFMRLWHVKSHVTSALSRRFVIGPLMVSDDWRSAQLRVYCRTEDECKELRLSVIDEPFDLWQHVKYSVTSLLYEQCTLKSNVLRHLWNMQKGDTALTEQSRMIDILKTHTRRHKKLVLRNADLFITIQQRQTGGVSFQRTWVEYENGFGDDTDFWIGLSAIHSLSMNGATLRVEMKLWDGTEVHEEYAGFKVGNASTNYRMTYREKLRDRSSVSFDAIWWHKGMQFSTMDRDNDRWRSASCSNTNGGRAGWWFNGLAGAGECHLVNPNGPYNPVDATRPWEYCSWHIDPSRQTTLRELRLMLQI